MEIIHFIFNVITNQLLKCKNFVFVSKSIINIKNMLTFFL